MQHDVNTILRQLITQHVKEITKIAHYRCEFILKNNILMNLFFTFLILVYFYVFHNMLGTSPYIRWTVEV